MSGLSDFPCYDALTKHGNVNIYSVKLQNMRNTIYFNRWKVKIIDINTILSLIHLFQIHQVQRHGTYIEVAPTKDVILELDVIDSRKEEERKAKEEEERKSREEQLRIEAEEMEIKRMMEEERARRAQEEEMERQKREEEGERNRIIELERLKRLEEENMERHKEEESRIKEAEELRIQVGLHFIKDH